MHSDYIEVFKDSLTIAESPILRDETAQMVRSTVVFAEDYRAFLSPAPKKGALRFLRLTTLQAARLLTPPCAEAPGRVAVLNFANPVESGGGVWRGASAQEESLCRSSNLYLGLRSGAAEKNYYSYHVEKGFALSSGRVIYSPGVCVFKTDGQMPVMLDMQDWYRIDVLTCAAPYRPALGCMDDVELAELFRRRIRGIFEVAVEREVSTLVLGAFGCGAFGNPPELVSRVFRELLEEERYRERFDLVVFAIPSAEDAPSLNLAVFEQSFHCRAERPVLPWEVGPQGEKPLTGLEPGALIAGRYLLDRPIFPPTCWAAQDSVLGIHTEIRFSELSRWQSAPEMLTGYKETLRILSEVRHPGLETCLAFIEDGTYLGVVYPLPEGEWQSLASLLRAGPLPPERAVCIVHQLADAIRVLHSVQPPIIYGDLCPRKVMIGPQDRVLLIELEYAFRERRDLLENVGYAAPEQYGSVSPPGPEVDVYGLGAILYHCLTGLCPADAPYCIQPLRTVDPTADVRLARLVSRCTRIKKETRCSLRQLLHSLEQLSGSRPCSTGTQPFS